MVLNNYTKKQTSIKNLQLPILLMTTYLTYHQINSKISILIITSYRAWPDIKYLVHCIQQNGQS